MRITANQIEEWANTREAQADLPLLIRKLIAATNQLTELSIPGGDSVYRTGWDGKVTSSNASSWVPKGKSVWEIGCNSSITSKANSDYKKRTKEVSKEFKNENSFIFVSPRRWHQKGNWLQEKRELNEWKSISVIDADDIETWLENAPSVTMEFSENLGISGFGIISIASYWKTWSSQSSPVISQQGIELERDKAKQTLKNLLENKKSLIIVEADSREEAIAFCCSALSNHPIRNNAIVVNDDNGWNFVERNPNILLCISGTYGSKHTLSPKEGLIIIQPVCHGDVSTPCENSNNRVVVTRLKPDDFKKALMELGEEESDARRLTASTGRSWSVYRRLKSSNPAIRTPPWLIEADNNSLAILMLIGAWDSSKNGDRVFIEELTNKSYEAIESSLIELTSVDDSPVIKISNIWKAKSPRELLYSLAPKVSPSLLNKFFLLSKAILEKNDPKLELPEDERYMAGMYGKVRSESGIIISSVLSSLSKLKVYAENSTSSNNREINYGIESVVKGLLLNADENRWMSLSSYLPSLAEATPDTYLSCLEHSLSLPNKPVTALITNTTGTGFGNNCWYSGLLWSLELIVWSASKLPRTTNILIELDKIPNDSNWANTPIGSLQSFYRPYSAQTLATPEQKIEILTHLVNRNPDFAWRFIFSIIPSSNIYSVSNSKPKWRDDDAGYDSEKNTYYPHYLSWIGKTVLDLAFGHPKRIARLLDVYSKFEGDYKQKLVELIQSIEDFNDSEKEVVLDRLRKHLSFHRTDYVDGEIDDDFAKLEAVYLANQAKDLLIRYRWLFNSGWVELPEGERKDYQKTEKLIREYREKAIQHIISSEGLEAIKRFKEGINDHYLLGSYLAKTELVNNFEELLLFTFELFLADGSKYQDQFVSGIISSISNEDLPAFLITFEKIMNELNLETKQQVSLLASLFPTMATFNLIKKLNNEVQISYWKSIEMNFRLDVEEFQFVLSKFIEQKRYRSAFSIIQHDFEKVEPEVLADILHNILSYPEESKFPDSYRLKEAIEYVSNCDILSQHQLAILEFGYLPIYECYNSIPENLKKELLVNPKMFVELVCYIYKAEGKKAGIEDIATNKNIAELSWKVMHHGWGVPGECENKSVDTEQFNNWIAETRKLGRDFDREAVTDEFIGHWLSRSPSEENGIWPCYQVCELLDQIDAEVIRQGFHYGVRNSRGVTSRAYGDGGRQERALAEKYIGHANKIQNIYPKTSDLLKSLAKSYEYDAQQEDDEANIRYEIE